MITWDQVADLLALAAVYDQRKADQLDIRAWLQVAQRGDWTADAAAAAIVEHYASGADRPRITPAAVTDRLRAIRRQAADTFVAPAIPADLPDRDYPAWLRRQRDQHVAALLARWASDGTEPPRELPPAVAPDHGGQARLAALTATAFHAIPAAMPGDQVADQGARRAALARTCGYCGARPHEACTRAAHGGRQRLAVLHPTRLEAAQ